MDARIYASYNGASPELLYSSAADDASSALINPQVKAEIGKAGSLTFTILPTHPMYDDLKPFKTFLKVEIDGTEIFYGRVLDTSKDIYNQKNVTCEGDLTFLLDSVCTPGDYNETVSAFFTRCINWHNAGVEAAKQFQIGTVSIAAKDTKVNFDVSNYTSIGDLIETELIGYYGGYLRTRANSNQNGKRIIDIVKEGDSSSNQVIEYGSQMLDLTNDESANDLFTVLLAVGDSDSNDGTDYNFPTYRYEVPGAVAQYGKITHVESFSGIKTAAELKPLAEEYVRTHYDPYPTELTIKAIDLHILDGSIQTIVVGNTVKIQSTPHNLSKNLMCVSIDYDLENPENTSYVFGHPKQSLSQRLNKDKKRQDSETSKASKRGGKSGGGGKKNAADLEEEIKERVSDIEKLTLTAENIEIYAKNVKASLDSLSVEVRNELKLKADRVELDAYLTVTKLSNLGNVILKNVSASGVYTSNLVIGGTKATWQAKNVTIDLNVSRGSANSAVVSGGQLAGVHSFNYVSSVSPNREWIHYLGYS